MQNQTSLELIRSHSLARFLNDEKLANLDAEGREFVSLTLGLANRQMRARCNNDVTELKSIDRELETLAQERVSANREYADWIEQEQTHLMRRKMAIRQSSARAKEQGYYKDHSGLKEAVDTGNPVPEGTDLPSFLIEAIEFVEIYGNPENNSNRANWYRSLNPVPWILLAIRELLSRFPFGS